MGRVTKKNDKFNLYVFIAFAVIVAGGWIYGLTSSDSPLNQAFQAAPWYMTILAVVVFFAGSFVTYKLVLKAKNSASMNPQVPVLIAAVATILLSILVAANFFSGAH